MWKVQDCTRVGDAHITANNFANEFASVELFDEFQANELRGEIQVKNRTLNNLGGLLSVNDVKREDHWRYRCADFCALFRFLDRDREALLRVGDWGPLAEESSGLALAPWVPLAEEPGVLGWKV